MALVANPLFLQTGRYRAQEDRYLIGAFTHPAGATESEVHEPLYGVLPYSRGTSAGTADLSFAISISTQPNSADSVRILKINRGAAIVPGLPDDGLEGSYLVVNDGSYDFTMDSITGGTSYLIYLRVLDAEKDAGAPVEGDSVKVKIEVMQDTGAAGRPTELHLLLASVTPTTGNPTGALITDLREFTTGHGGTLLVKESTVLSQPRYDLSSFGTTVHVAGEGKTVIRTKNGWQQLGVISTGVSAAKPPAADLSTGQFWFDSEQNVVYVKGTTEILPVSETRGEVKRTTTAGWTAERHQFFRASGQFIIEHAHSGTFENMGAFSPIQGPRPSASDLQFVVKVTGDKTLVQATLTFEGFTTNASNVVATCWFWTAWKIMKGSGVAFTTPVPGYPFTNNYEATARYGQRIKQEWDMTKSRTVPFVLPVGEYLLEPMFILDHGGSGTTPIRANISFFNAEVVI